MKEAKLKAELTRNVDVKTYYYGKSATKQVVENTFISEYDKRKIISNFGIKAKIKMGNETLEVQVDKEYLSYEEDGRYLAFFNIGQTQYELFVIFDGNTIVDVWLSYWLFTCDFQKGEDADRIYHKDEFETITLL